MRVAVVGTRSASEENYALLLKYIPRNCTEIVSGGAEGIDELAERYAKENRLLLKVFLPDYKKYGRNAPKIRNEQIVEYADYVCAFWDKKSRGTAHTLKKCIDLNKPVEIYSLEGEDGAEL